MNIKLRPGDILLFEVVPNSPWHDKLIAFGEKLLGKQFAKASYCHAAMIDIDTELMLEAVWPKTHVIKIKSRNNKIQVFRVKNATKEQCLKAVEEAHKDLGLWYNIGKLFFGLFPRKHEVICSTYVGISWKAAGKKFAKLNDKVFSPDEMASDPLVMHVGELILTGK
jgi:hypothetical protein